jgi:peroxiredoxin
VRCRILKNLDSRDRFGGTLDFAFSGEIMKVNDIAPHFTLQNENGEAVSLKELHGKVIVLFFYPRANTPG